eukprot:9153420-Pyramimonas_sp.AAC.1
MSGPQKIQTTPRGRKSQLAAQSRAAMEKNKVKLWSAYSAEIESSINVPGNFADDGYYHVAVAEEARAADAKELP